MENTELIVNGIEIKSVSDFVDEIHTLNEMMEDEGSSEELFFRGQEVDSWPIVPSVFRDDMLSVEHKLMQIPLLKCPSEFSSFNDTFDIMTKYQHYGMCTRLLDLTSNPLVALYFACKIHNPKAIDMETEEPNGVVYYKKAYPELANNFNVKIITYLAQNDLSRENTLEAVVEKLYTDEIINDILKEKWLSNENYQDFIKILQDNYLVIPTNSNERLSRQSGYFLLAGMFSVLSDIDYKKSIITKSVCDLKGEFESQYFYIKGINKEKILQELNRYGINESTLFPELEHQLNYIKEDNKQNTIEVPAYTKFQEYVEENLSEISIENEDKLNEYILANLYKLVGDEILKEDIDATEIIVKNNIEIDWYKRKSTLSRIKNEIMGYYYTKYFKKNEAKQKTDNTMNYIIKLVNYYDKNIEDNNK